MWVKNLAECHEIVANDLCALRELMHPEHDSLPIGYSLAHAVIRPGQRTLRHHLEYVLRANQVFQPAFSEVAQGGLHGHAVADQLRRGR